MDLPEPDYENLLDYFPFESLRQNQEVILNEFKEHLLNPDVKYIVCQAATGTGKSGLALAAARASKSAYIATANKILQDQYENDFDTMLVNLKGRANYKCYKHTGFNCGDSPCRKSPELRQECDSSASCQYHIQRLKASKASVTSFNFASALPFLNYVSTYFPKRNLLVCDEAHSVWSWITNFISVDLSLSFLKSIDIIEEIPNYDVVNDYLALIKEIESTAQNYLKLPDLNGEVVEKLENLIKKIKIFDIITDGKTNVDNFILDKTFDVKDFRKITNLSFKPVMVSQLLHDFFFKYAEKTILLSAVILDFETYFDLMGIDPKEARVIEIDSTFPVENRPIYTYEAVGKFNKDNLQSYIPDICFKIDELMNIYRGVKGIIHAVSWDLSNKIYNGLPQISRDRILYAKATDEIVNQTDLLTEHGTIEDPTVLLSPSMTEGVDLKGDLSRLQLIVKIPYPYLGDPLVLKRMKLYPNFYRMLTAQTIVQMYGRSVRSNTDFCDTYILDGNFIRFVEQNRDILPASFVKAIVRREPFH